MASNNDATPLEMLLSAHNQFQQITSNMVGLLDKQVEKAATSVRDVLAHATWLPDALKQPLEPPPPPPPLILPVSAVHRARAWLNDNRLLSGVAVVAVGAVAYDVYRRHNRGRKVRRARRAKNGGRIDVVVIAGSPSLPLTKSLANDLERRGFIVYIVCGSLEDESDVRKLSRPDIRSLSIDITKPGAAIDNFASYLQTSHSPTPHAKPNVLSLKSVILIPSLNYEVSPIAAIKPSRFADLFNTHLLHPILTIQAFLPLLTARLNPIGEKWTPAKVLVFTPSIISSINPPFHAPEATICSALSAFTEVLTAELRPLSIPVVHMQLGTFDLTSFTPTSGSGQSRPLPLDGSPSVRQTYGRNFTALSTSSIPPTRIRGLKGSPLRRLHRVAFDVIDGSISGDTVRVGLGASIYGLVGRWAPRSLVLWIMGMRRVDELPTWQSSSTDVSREESVDGEIRTEFVSIPADSGLDGSEWKEV